jgi:hypothetical protein
VCAVDTEVQRGATRCGVDLDNRILKWLTGREPAIGLDGERDDDLDAGRSSSLHYPYRLAGMGCRQQRDSIGAGGNERVDLRAVVTRSLLRSEELGGVVTIAAWPDVAADDDLDVDIVTQCPHEPHGVAVDAVQLIVVVAESGAPVRVGSPGRCLQYDAPTRFRSDTKVVPEVLREQRPATGGVKQRERREVGKIDPPEEDQPGLEATIGEQRRGHVELLAVAC